jgi:glycine hydroxymethyltransferase
MHIVAAKAVMYGEALKDEFRVYARRICENAKTLSAALGEKGYRIVSGGTDTHLLVVDLTAKGVTGRDAEVALDLAGINANRNTIPFDAQSPMVTSGIRLGTPAVTTRGFGDAEVKRIAELFDLAIQRRADLAALAKIKNDVADLCKAFPIYPGSLGSD